MSNSNEDVEKVDEVVEELASEESATEETAGADPTLEVVPEPPAENTESLQNQLLRLSADFDNFRKRTRREKEVWTQQAQERIITELLTVIDHFELGLRNAEQQEAKPEVMDGFRMVHNQFVGVLSRFGVQSISTENAAFNPAVHEAVSYMNSEEKAENEIIAETRKGYTSGDKLIRAAQVVVSSGPASAS